MLSKPRGFRPTQGGIGFDVLFQHLFFGVLPRDRTPPTTANLTPLLPSPAEAGTCSPEEEGGEEKWVRFVIFHILRAYNFCGECESGGQ